MEKVFKVYDIAGREVLRVKMRGKSFSFDPIEDEHATYYTQFNLKEIWHKRLHYHLERMLKIKKNEMPKGVPTLSDNLENCNAFQFDKKYRKTFPKSTWRAYQQLLLIHTHVVRPQRTPSIQGSLYFVLFINDFTSMCWIFFLKFKHEVRRVFIKFKKMGRSIHQQHLINFVKMQELSNN